MSWNKITETLPPENVTVWLYNEKTRFVALGVYVYIKNEEWFFAVSNGIIYSEDGQIVTECDIDDYEFTHWHEVPKLPLI